MKLSDVVKRLKKYLKKEQKEELKIKLREAGFNIRLSSQVSDIVFLEEKWEYTIHKVWWKGQKVIRDMPFEHYYLRKRSGSEYHYYLIAGDFKSDTWGLIPLEDEDDLLDSKWFDYEGEVPPDSAYNPNKEIPAHDEILDKGILIIEPDSQIVTFKGKTLKGKYWYEGKWKDGPVLHKVTT